jgi:hypothetical protein
MSDDPQGLHEYRAEIERLQRGGKELGKIVVILGDLIKDAYVKGADDPIGALHLLGDYLAEVLEGEGGLPVDEHNRVYRALEDQRRDLAERDALKACVGYRAQVDQINASTPTPTEEPGNE